MYMHVCTYMHTYIDMYVNTVPRTYNNHVVGSGHMNTYMNTLLLPGWNI